MGELVHDREGPDFSKKKKKKNQFVTGIFKCYLNLMKTLDSRCDKVVVLFVSNYLREIKFRFAT